MGLLGFYKWWKAHNKYNYLAVKTAAREGAIASLMRRSGMSSSSARLGPRVTSATPDGPSVESAARTRRKAEKTVKDVPTIYAVSGLGKAT